MKEYRCSSQAAVAEGVRLPDAVRRGGARGADGDSGLRTEARFSVLTKMHLRAHRRTVCYYFKVK